MVSGDGQFEVCFDFQAGRCTRGDGCRYSHDNGKTAGRGADGCYECGEMGHFGRDCPVRDAASLAPSVIPLRGLSPP